MFGRRRKRWSCRGIRGVSIYRLDRTPEIRALSCEIGAYALHLPALMRYEAPAASGAGLYRPAPVRQRAVRKYGQVGSDSTLLTSLSRLWIPRDVRATARRRVDLLTYANVDPDASVGAHVAQQLVEQKLARR